MAPRYRTRTLDEGESQAIKSVITTFVIGTIIAACLVSNLRH